jgi:nicotinate-nucleotide adenylyltransferase
MVTFVTAMREKSPPPGISRELEERLKGRPLRSVLLSVPPLLVSSTQVRRRIAEGRSIEDLVPPAVADYIEEHGLYLG